MREVNHFNSVEDQYETVDGNCLLRRSRVPQCTCHKAGEPHTQLFKDIVTVCQSCEMPIIAMWFSWNQPVGQSPNGGHYYVLERDGTIDRGDLASGLEVIHEDGCDDDGNSYESLLKLIEDATFTDDVLKMYPPKWDGKPKS